MDIEVELALEVVAAELAKVCFVPDDDRGMPDAVEAWPAREQRVDDGRDMLEVLLYELALRGVVSTVSAGGANRTRTMVVAGGGGGRRGRPLPKGIFEALILA